MQHSFDVEIATKYGIAEAILLNNLYFWIKHNSANETNYYDGMYWTYNSVRAYKDLFPYFGEKKLKNALSNLENEELIVTGNYNKLPFDKTKWYAITEKGYSVIEKGLFESTQKDNSVIPKRLTGYPQKTNGISSKDQAIPDIKPDNKNTDNKHIYGEYKHVRLSDDELNKLNAQYGEKKTQAAIKLLDESMEMKGYKYKSCYLAMKKWVFRAVEENGFSEKENNSVTEEFSGMTPEEMLKAFIEKENEKYAKKDG